MTQLQEEMKRLFQNARDKVMSNYQKLGNSGILARDVLSELEQKQLDLENEMRKANGLNNQVQANAVLQEADIYIRQKEKEIYG